VSYDLQIWSVKPFEASHLPSSAKWKHPLETQWVHEGTSWQISIFRSDRVLLEDIPEEIAGMLPGIQYMTQVHLEGKQFEQSLKLLKITSNTIAKAAHGVIEDQQEGSTRTPSGVKRFTPPRGQKSFSVLSFSWWFLDDALFSTKCLASLVSVLERTLPEAMPRRYGQWEPPQHIYAETGRAHFLTFLKEEAQGLVVWYPHRPVTDVHLGQPRPVGAGELGFRTNRFELEIESAVLLQPGWPENLRNFWRETSLLIQPIYGEVRLLGGRERRGGTVMIAPPGRRNSAAHTPRAGWAEKVRSAWKQISGSKELTAERNPETKPKNGLASALEGSGLPVSGPVKAWWWRGVPNQLGCAVVLGPEYQKLWPEFMAKAKIEEGLAFSATENWLTTQDLSESVGAPPNAITMRPESVVNAAQQYPEDWPLPPPFAAQEK